MATTVKFGDADATDVTVVSPTEVTATSPAGTGDVPVVVTTDGGSDSFDSFTYEEPIPAPTITSIDPNVGPVAGATAVTITGTGFTGATGVNFAGTGGTDFTVVSATEITVTSPAGDAGAADVAVLHPSGDAVEAGGFTYVAAPTVTGIEPATGPEEGGTEVTITGTGFQS